MSVEPANQEKIIESQWFAFSKFEIKNFILLEILDFDYWALYIILVIVTFFISFLENTDFLAFKIGLSYCFCALLIEITSIIYILNSTKNFLKRKIVFNLEKKQITILFENSNEETFVANKNIIHNLNYLKNKYINLSNYFFLTETDRHGYTRANTKNISRIIPISALLPNQIKLLSAISSV